MPTTLLPQAFWFRLAVPCRRVDGVPGPATIKTLVKYAAMCGVGNSARFIRKQALNVTKLLTVSSPDVFVENLTKLHFEKPELGVAGPHLYPFGGFDKLLDWVSSRSS